MTDMWNNASDIMMYNRRRSELYNVQDTTSMEK